MPTNVDVNMKSAKPHNPAASGSPTNNKKRKRGHDPLGHSNREVSEKVSEKNSGLKERAKSLWPARKTLPVWSHVSEIRQGLREKDVMLLVGETGSGKSTQVPQILASEPWCRPQGMYVNFWHLYRSLTPFSSIISSVLFCGNGLNFVAQSLELSHCLKYR